MTTRRKYNTKTKRKIKGKSKRKIKGKSKRKSRKRSKKYKMKQYTRTRTSTRTSTRNRTQGSRLGGGGGSSTSYCKPCTDILNLHNVGNSSADKLAETVYYSTLLRTKKNCFNCLNGIRVQLKNNKNARITATYNQALRQIVPMMEKIQKAIDIQKRQAANPNRYYPMLEGLYNDMMRTRINNIK